MKKAFLYIIVIVCFLSQFFGGCANSSRGPSGGPKDSLPPTILAQSPLNNNTSFKGKEVSFTFNEYVQLKDQNKNFVMSPPIEKRPILKIKGKQVVVSFPSDLAPNTTYFLDFGTSVVDLNEGNQADDLSMVFSTGDHIDSMIYVGRLVDAHTLDPIEGASVFLYEENIDSIPYLKNPNALSRTDKDGVFRIKGLKPIDYKIVAVEDLNSNNKYDPTGEKIAFYNQPTKPRSITSSDSLEYNELPVLLMFQENVRKQFLSSYKQPEKRQLELIFNQINPQISSFEFTNLSKNDFIIEHNRWNDTLKYWIKTEQVPDSLNAVINYLRTDSLNQLSPTEVKLKFTIEKKANENANQSNRQRNKKDDDEKPKVLSPVILSDPKTIAESNIEFRFTTPLIKVDTSKIILLGVPFDKETKDTLKYQLVQDTLFIRNYKLKAKWETASRYELVVLPDAFTDIYRLKNDTIINTFETADPNKFSTLIVNLSNTTTSYIIQIIKDKKNIISQKYADKDGKVTFKYLEPGKYRIRIIEDKNSNRIWDAGLYLAGEQAERVAYVKFAEGASPEELELRANWEIEQPINIRQIFNSDNSADSKKELPDNSNEKLTIEIDE